MCVKKFFNDFKIAMVFVGTIIGAGFATGREIALYFGGYGFFTALLGGLFCGLLCFLFMLVGKVGVKYMGKKSGRFLTITASVITLAAMSAAINELLGKNILFAGIIMCLLCLIFVGKDMKHLQNINTIIIVLVISMLIFLAIKKGSVSVVGKMSLYRGISYAAMNILLTSELAVHYGKERSMKSIINISSITAISLSALILLIFCLINNGYMSEPMPVYSVANEIGYAPLAIAVISGAIFTTMLSAVTLLERETRELIADKGNRYLFIIAIAIVAGYVPFASIVNNFYHLISIGGAVASLFALISLTIYKVNGKEPLAKQIKNVSRGKSVNNHSVK